MNESLFLLSSNTLKNNDVGESLGNKIVCRKNENLERNQHTRDYSLVGTPENGPPSCETPWQPTIHTYF